LFDDISEMGHLIHFATDARVGLWGWQIKWIFFRLDLIKMAAGCYTGNFKGQYL